MLGGKRAIRFHVSKIHHQNWALPASVKCLHPSVALVCVVDLWTDTRSQVQSGSETANRKGSYDLVSVCNTDVVKHMSMKLQRNL